MTYNHPVQSLAPPAQSLASSAQSLAPPAQYASSPVPVQSAQPQSDAPPDYNSVMKNLENYPVVYQDPVSGRYYAVDENGNSYWLNGGSRRRKYKKRLQKTKSKSKSKSRSKKGLRK